MEKGKIGAFKQEGLMIPMTILSGMLKLFEEKDFKKIYKATKEGGDIWVKNMKKDYGKMSGQEAVMWSSKLVTFAGWGELNVVSVKPKDSTVIYELKNSALVETRGKSRKAIDHMTRGLVAGTVTQGFEIDAEAVEVCCKAKGDYACRFVVKEKNSFDKNHPLVKEQLGEL
ncbi:MAG: 4-vinyl reductase [archaeon]